MMNLESIDALLQAAEYLERRDREADHGYASTLPMHEDLRNATKRPKTKKSQGNRTSHNELEKNRRAHLRTCLEKLKEMVPLGPEASRHTTLGLLTKAKRFIKNLEERDRKNLAYKDQLNRERRYLKRRLDQLSSNGNHHHTATMSKRRSVSECSSSTISSNHSTASHSSAPSPISETGESGYSSSSIPSPNTAISDHAYHRLPMAHYLNDEVDVIGYTSTQSDTDDHSSVQSASSDSGVTMSTRLLTISEIMERAYM